MFNDLLCGVVELMLTVVLLILALVCFVIAATAGILGITSTRVHLGWLGAALLTVVLLIEKWPHR